MKDFQVSCIIPAYNEGPRILGVLKAVCGNPLVTEVIVVDDGSTDGTRELLKAHEGIHLIALPKNHGKTFAVMTGLKQARHDHVLLLDADLQGLTAEAITELIEPVMKGEADMTLSLRKNSLSVFRYLNLDFISGERVFHRRVLGDLNALSKLTGFGLEVFLNQKAIEQNLRMKSVDFKDVITPRKFVKFGWLKGVWGDFTMIIELLFSTRFYGLFVQFYQMKRLCSPRALRTVRPTSSRNIDSLF